MLEIHDLPHVLAALNAASVVVLLWGYARIKSGDRDGHRKTMIVAGVIGVLFLAIYFYYHAHAGLAKFGGLGLVRPAYFTLLAIHVLAAFAVAVIVPLAVFNAVKRQFGTSPPDRSLGLAAVDVRLPVRPGGLCHGGSPLSHCRELTS